MAVEPDGIDVAGVVANQYESTHTYAAEVFESLQEVIESLVELDTDPPWSKGLGGLSAVGDLERPAFPEMPVMPTLEFTAPVKPDKPAFQELVLPTMPDVPDVELPEFTGTFDYQQNYYDTADLVVFRSRLEDFIFNGGTGLSTAVEAAIYERDRIRRQDADERQLVDVQNHFEGRGISLPHGEMSAAVNKTFADRVLADQLLSKDIMIKAAELEQENMRIAQETLTKVDIILADIHDREENRELLSETSKIDALSKVFESVVSAALSKLEVHKLTVESMVAYIEANAKILSATVSTYTAEVSAYGTEVSAEASRVGATAEIYGKHVSGVAAAIDALSKISSLDIEQMKLVSTQEVAGAELELREMDMNLDLLTKNLQIKVEGLRAAATVSAQVVASALTSVNTSASLGHSVSQAFSHSNDETKGLATGLQTIEYHTVEGPVS